MFYGLSRIFDITNARRELGFSRKPPRQAVLEAFACLIGQEGRLTSRQG